MTTDHASERLAIQHRLHDLIKDRADDLVREAKLSLPDLSALGNGESSAIWYPIPGMYGGFRFWFADGGGNLKLIVESWSRVVGGSGQRHEITKDECVLVVEGFV